MKEEEFCKIYSEYHGEKIDNLKQLKQANFSGEELMEFCQFISSSYISKDKVMEIVEKAILAGMVEGSKDYRIDSIINQFKEEILKKEYGL